MSKMARCTAIVGLLILVALPVFAQTASTNTPKSDAVEFVVLAQSAVLEITPRTGSLKETVQKGQRLIWRRKEIPNEGRFQVTDISVAFLRSEAGGQVKMTFSGDISALGYLTSDEARLNVIVRSKGGASLYSWNLGISVKCTDNNLALTPLTHDIPNDVAVNVFANVGSVEIAEFNSEPNSPGVRVQPCG
jgi:hypothetical protein